jgi:hypothetical protein
MTEHTVSIDELDTLTLTGLEVFAHHGVFDFERANGQTFILDLTVWLDTAGAAAASATSSRRSPSASRLSCSRIRSPSACA